MPPAASTTAAGATESEETFPMNTPKAPHHANRPRRVSDAPSPTPTEVGVDPDTDSDDPAAEGNAPKVPPRYPQPVYEWKPTPEAPVTIGWQALEGDRFRVYVSVILPDPTAPGGTSSQRIVDDVVGRHRPLLPFSARSDSFPVTFVSGGFEWQQPIGRQRLVVDELRYPGGYVRRHVLV